MILFALSAKIQVQIGGSIGYNRVIRSASIKKSEGKDDSEDQDENATPLHKDLKFKSSAKNLGCAAISTGIAYVGEEGMIELVGILGTSWPHKKDSDFDHFWNIGIHTSFLYRFTSKIALGITGGIEWNKFQSYKISQDFRVEGKETENAQFKFIDNSSAIPLNYLIGIKAKYQVMPYFHLNLQGQYLLHKSFPAIISKEQTKQDAASVSINQSFIQIRILCGFEFTKEIYS